MSKKLSGGHPNLITIVGPTASGKSGLAMDIALTYGGEIVCADSQTIRKGMDIGTAKPSESDRALVRHHLVDIIGPGDSFSAADFKKRAELAIADIRSRGKLPILVGGTGLYIDAVVFNFQFYGPSNLQTRQELESKTVCELVNDIRQKGIEVPENRANKRHLIRALEVGGLEKANYDSIPEGIEMVGLAPSREILAQRIEERVLEMIRQGILDELLTFCKNYEPTIKKADAIAYNIALTMVRELGYIDEELFRERFMSADRKYAKRQLTWFKRNPHIHWFSSDVEARAYLASIL